MIVDGKVPDVIKDSLVYSLDLGAPLAETKYRGDFEKRLKNLSATTSKRSRCQCLALLSCQAGERYQNRICFITEFLAELSLNNEYTDDMATQY
jgi:hypothetical protein